MLQVSCLCISAKELEFKIDGSSESEVIVSTIVLLKDLLTVRKMTSVKCTLSLKILDLHF